MAEVASLYSGSNFTKLHGEIDAAVLLSQIGNGDSSPPFSSSSLEVAAYTATTQFFEEMSLDGFSRGSTTSDQSQRLSWAVANWRALFETRVIAQNGKVSISDLSLYVACGVLNKQQAEVRALLKRPVFRAIVDDSSNAEIGADWSSTCESYVTYAVLILVRQSDHSDVNAASAAIKKLIALQEANREIISDRAANKTNSANLATVGLYHLAQATIRTSEYLLTGRVMRGDGSSTNFELELKRLLNKAEEFVEASGSPEYILSIRSIGATLWTIFDQSIWRQASGLSGPIDALLSELATRENPIFSLLPSQQQALKLHLLDTAQVAIVLQMPTSAGKTLLAEFSILQAFEAYKRENTKVLYIAPTKALCTQTYRTLSQDFAGLDIPVQMASSAFEEDPFELALFSGFTNGVVVSTPEKTDLFLRSHPEWFTNVRLVVVDEAHLLSEKERGVRLELLLANIRREQANARFLLLTPFVENAEVVAEWLGGVRSTPISIHWRPSRLLVGIATCKKKLKIRKFNIDWKEPFGAIKDPEPLKFEIPHDGASDSALNRVVSLYGSFKSMGLVLGMFPSSRKYAEDAALRIASSSLESLPSAWSAELRFAIALAQSEYGNESSLAFCLKRGSAFHHAALSPELRFLIEELGRGRKLDFLAATTTLAQGINFPVATVLVHSVNKPFGGGDLSASEFWNIAGRAGRVGLADKGLIVFANSAHRSKWEFYTNKLSEPIVSALLNVLSAVAGETSLKQAYRLFPQVRPFIQYLAHSAVKLTPSGAIAALEEILEASFANAVSAERSERRLLRDLAVRYLSEISGKSIGYLKAADTTGFSSFSFDELYAKIPSSGVLKRGPGEVLRGGAESLAHLVEALAYLPELELALGKGAGMIDLAAISRVVDGWMGGKCVHELAGEFHGKELDRIRNAGAYLFSTVSQTISWGAHAYIKGWSMRSGKTDAKPTINDLMLPAYIQHGVNTPEAAVAALFGVPRLMAEPIAKTYRQRQGDLTPETVEKFRSFIEHADDSVWDEAVQQSRLHNKIEGKQVRGVWRQMRGLSE
jgi:helicase